MQKQILINGQWTNGEPTLEGQQFRFKIPVGNQFGYQQQAHTLVPAPDHRTNVTMIELIFLMEKNAYSKVHRAAYPKGNSPEDDKALYFIESKRYSLGESIDVASEEMANALDDFITANYISQADKTRITEGVQI